MAASRDERVDFIVLGAGIAGVRAAIELARAGRVLVLSKGELAESRAEWGHVGIAVTKGDDEEVHLRLHETLQAGDGLCNEEAARFLVNEGPRQIETLIGWGMRLERTGTKLAFTREGVRTQTRVLHAHGGSTGEEVLRALVAKARTLPGIKFRPHSFVPDLIADGHRIVGVSCLDETTSTAKPILGDAVLVATEGFGQVYKSTTNPSLATGDGSAAAYRAGALLSDMEFIHFHPTALHLKGAPRLPLPGELRQMGAHLRNIDLERFMPRYHEDADRAPTNVLCRASIMEMQRCGSDFVYLDLTELDAECVKKRFPKVHATCIKFNIDITEDLVPVRPAAHYAVGGIAVDLNGATTLPGLYAVGEAAANGVHGANRLADNSLLEGLVYGALTATTMAERQSSPVAMPQPVAGRSPWNSSAPARGGRNAKLPPPQKLDAEKLSSEVRHLMWEKVGIIRTGDQLDEAVRRLQGISAAEEPTTASRPAWEARNLRDVAEVIARSALARQESRGTHYRSDFPLKAESQPALHSYVSKGAGVYFG
ncbi:MAG TPA: FAD-binding protein [Terriglobia bacterium]|nr:FAD-binding protein [Terriglobia bacterium]